MKILADENIPLRAVIQAITQAEGRQWSGLLVVMRDYAQSTWRARQDENSDP